VILLLIPFGGVVLGVALWLSLRGLGALDMGAERPVRVSFRERRESRGSRERGAPFSFRPAPEGVREWADRIPQGCLIAVIVATAVWLLGWLIFLIYGLNLLS